MHPAPLAVMDYVGPEQNWPEEQIAFVLRDSLKALAYLHSKERIHRDISTKTFACFFSSYWS